MHDGNTPQEPENDLANHATGKQLLQITATRQTSAQRSNTGVASALPSPTTSKPNLGNWT